jgi:hypothetical protein
MSYKLFIPGPIAVSEKTLRAMTQPMIGHRSTDFVALYQSIQPDLQAVASAPRTRLPLDQQRLGRDGGLPPQRRQKKVLNCMNGAFSDKWYDVAAALRLGRPPPSSSNGASRSTRSPCAGARHRRLRRRHPHSQRDLLRLHERPARHHGGAARVSPTSSRSSTPSAPQRAADQEGRTRHRRLVTGSQKAFALPPGLSILSVSQARPRPRRHHDRPRLLFRLPRIPEEPRSRHDAQHAGHPADLRAQVEARGHQGRGPREPLRPPRAPQPDRARSRASRTASSCSRRTATAR